MKPQLPVNLVNPVNPVQFLSLSVCLRVSVVNPSVSNHRRLQGTHVAAWDMSGQTNAGEAIRRWWAGTGSPRSGPLSGFPAVLEFPDRPFGIL